MADEDVDDLDGCEEDFNDHLVTDEEVPYVALFAGVPEEDIEQVAAEYRETLG